MRNEKGFSIIEAMVAMGILYGAIILSMNFLDVQNKSRDQRVKQSMQRYIVIQVTQHINANWPFYPTLKPADLSKKVVYVGCLNKDGQLMGKYHLKIIQDFNETVSTESCPITKTHYEVRFFWINALNDEIKINLLTKNTHGAGILAVHNFKIFAK